MITFLTILHIVVCLFLILVVLLQAGKGGGMGIAFGGGGGSQTVFGSSGAGNFLTRLTSITAAIFLVTSLGLAHFSSQQDSKRLQRLAEQKQVEKKADDERAAKLKQELDQARENASKQSAAPTATTPPAETPLPAPGVTKPSEDGNNKAATGKGTTATVGDKAAEKPAEKTIKKKRVEGEGASAGGEDKAAGKPAKPAKKPREGDGQGERQSAPTAPPPTP